MMMNKQKTIFLLLVLTFGCWSGTKKGVSSQLLHKAPASRALEDSLGDEKSDSWAFNGKEKILNLSQSQRDALLKEGDFIFQETTSQQGPALSEVTHSIWTHVGILFKAIEGQRVSVGAKKFAVSKGDWLVMEAVQPVRYSTLENFIGRSRNFNTAIKRLSPQSLTSLDSDFVEGSRLSKKAITALRKSGAKYMGKSYDILFEASDDKIYCSELTHKVFRDALNIEIGVWVPASQIFSKISESSKSHQVKKLYPNSFPLIRSRFKGGVESSQFQNWLSKNTLVTPVSQIKSPKLINVSL